MAEQELPIKKISMTNTKQEMLKAYNRLLKELQEKKEVELKPEKQLEEKKKKEVVQVADSLSSEGVVKGISDLKVEIGKMLTQISDEAPRRKRTGYLWCKLHNGSYFKKL